MANSKYEYVKSFEVEDNLMPSMWIVVHNHAHNFLSFSETHEFKKPNDERALNLMNLCAKTTLEEYPDIVFAFGFGDEYSFVFKMQSQFYERRASKMVSLVVSFFSSVYVLKWKEFFPLKGLKCNPSFVGRISCFPSAKILQDYLVWRQVECHTINQYNTCFWELVMSGKTKSEAQDILKGTQKQEKNELLFQQFGINYDTLPAIFRKGSCVFRVKKEEIVKYNESGDPVKRLRKKVIVAHGVKIGPSFWSEHPELGQFEEDSSNVSMANSKYEYVKYFEVRNKLMPFTWIVVRIDGCHFHRFSEVHEFEKPNDKQALDLMNLCAVAMLEEFPDIVFSYGVSDEYSFVLKETSQFCDRHASEIVSLIVSLFSSVYAMTWKEFFPQKELKYPPSFDGRAVCYPSAMILQDYLAWRQVDCHINNQYNTCFWELVKSVKTKREAQDILKGTQTREKNELLSQQFGINYDTLPVMFRKGSCVFRDEVKEIVNCQESEDPDKRSLQKVIIDHCDIIEPGFWSLHPSILHEENVHR